MILIDSNTIGNAAPTADWVAAMEKALVDYATGKAEAPKRTHIDRGRNTWLVMPCFGDEFSSTKLVSVFPENLKKNKAVVNGTVILNDGKTGEPLAALDGGKLTAMRTAAVGAVAIKFLAPEDATALGIIGLGIQGIHQALFACQQRSIKELRILDRTASVMKRFKERFNAFYRDVKVIPCNNAIELCQGSEIVITTTGSRHPVTPGKDRWWYGKTMIGIGSYKPEMREFPDEIFSDLDQVFVDTMDAITESGDLFIPAQKGLIREDQIFPVAELVQQKQAAEGDTRFFKSVGMAVFDLYGARLVYDNIR